MKQVNPIKISLFLLLLSFSGGFKNLWAQCMYYPISLEQRVEKATNVVLGKIISQHCYTGPDNNIYTLNEFRIEACLKNNTGAQSVCIITMGGVLNDRATIAYPSLQLETYNEYILFLEGDNHQFDDKNFRASHPGLIQSLAYADGQGALTGQFGFYHDLLAEPKRDEAGTFSRISALTGEPVTTPEGDVFQPRVYDGSGMNKMMPITSFSPSPTNAGTIVPGEFITILGSGFGASAGTVFYTNADDGGATFTSSGIASDNTTWADGSITNKVARRAGTGPINVNGTMTSGSNLTVNYSHLNVNSTFSGFGSSTRQRYYHRNLNGAGGVYFLYNTTSGMSANAPAVAALERAMETWRCNTFINWFSNGTTATGVNGVDGLNVILFDGTLAPGVLGQAVSNFSGSASGGCTLANTVWWVVDMDIRFFPDPPTAGFPWEYGPALPAFAEYDFESVAVHEFGHAHGLGHVIFAGAVMHFSLANGSTSRTLSANDIAGGSARMAYSSVATCFNPAGSGTPMTLLTPATSALPVTLLSLDGNFTPDGNEITWMTTHEISNYGFELERSYDGIHFIEIGFIPGSGNAQEFSSYGFLDAKSGNFPVYYYRLNQLDLNGGGNTSNTIQITNPGNSFPIGIYPSIANSEISVQGLELVHAAINFQIYTSDGKSLFSGRVDAGNNAIDVSRLAQGVYFCRLINEGGTPVMKKFVKAD